MAVADAARRRTRRPGPRQVLADAIGERDLTGARDVAAVIDARIRRRTGALVPRPAGPWSAQVPAIADPERRAYADQIAAAMDARKERIGEHAAASALPWAVAALGPVPDDPAARLDWQQRAASVGAYRELSGYARPRRPGRPRTRRSRPGPARRLARGAGRPRPGRRARRPRHARRDAAAPARHLPRRNRLGAAMDRHELRQARIAARDARLAALRAAAEAAPPAAGASTSSQPAAGPGGQL